MTDFERKIKRKNLEHKHQDMDYTDCWLEQQEKQFVSGYFLGKYRPYFPARVDLGTILIPMGTMFFIIGLLALVTSTIIGGIFSCLIGVIEIVVGVLVHIEFKKRKKGHPGQRKK